MNQIMKYNTIRIIAVIFLFQVLQILVSPALMAGANNLPDDSLGLASVVSSDNETVLLDCQADFYYLELPNFSATLAFFDSSTPEMASWLWDFGEGGISTEQNPVYTFPQSGYYNVCLTVQDSTGQCVDTECKDVFVPGVGDCQAGFIYFFDAVNPLQVNFLDVSLGNITIWNWDFGDGFASTETNPVHIYPQTGTYEVCLTIMDTISGCLSVFCDNVQFANQDSCTAFFEWAEFEPGMVQFIDLSIGGPAYWLWDFGDAFYSADQNPQHQYAQGGIYTVCLTISDSTGLCQDTYCRDVEVLSDTLCQAGFSFEVSNQNPFEVQFTDQSAGEIAFWEWDFGDGEFSMEQNPVHQYSQYGNYNVCLTVSNNSGNCSSVFCDEIEILSPNICVADFDFELLPDEPLALKFTDISQGEPNQWVWDFGDGDFSVVQNPVHVFPDTGSYLVKFFIYNSDSLFFCSDSLAKMVNVTVEMPECIADFTMHPDSGVNRPNLYHFHDLSENNPDAWLWDFGDGQISTDKNPVHQYGSGGSYEVSLSVTKYNVWGDDCTDTKIITMQTPAYFHIGGFIYTGNFPINNPEPTGDTAIVYLYRYHDKYHVANIDTTIVIENGYFHALFLLEDNYLIKYRLTKGSANAPYYFPMYYGDKMRWQNAPVLALADSSHYSVNVHLAEIPTVEGGIGAISGTIEHHSNADAQIPAGDAEILIFNASDEAVGYVHSSDDGTFGFENLAFGTYTLYAESTGLFTEPLTVTLSEATPGIFDLKMELFETDVTAVGENTGLQQTGIQIFPNPVNNILNVSVTNLNQNLNFRIFDFSGREILSSSAKAYADSRSIQIDVSRFDQGIYFLKVFSDDFLYSESLKFIKSY